jgi:hypothetical protein
MHAAARGTGIRPASRLRRDAEQGARDRRAAEAARDPVPASYSELRSRNSPTQAGTGVWLSRARRSSTSMISIIVSRP